MEAGNNKRTSHVSKLIEEAKIKGQEVIIIGSGDSGKAELMALMARIDDIKDTVIVVNDINKLLEDKKKNPVFERPPIPIINTHEPLPEIKLRRDDMNKQWYEKLSPSGKKRRKW